MHRLYNVHVQCTVYTVQPLKQKVLRTLTGKELQNFYWKLERARMTFRSAANGFNLNREQVAHISYVFVIFHYLE